VAISPGQDLPVNKEKHPQTNLIDVLFLQIDANAAWRHKVYYKSPSMWYAETDIAENKRFYLSDGETVWYCSELQNKVVQLKKWDLKKLDKESLNLALFVLLCQGLDGITFIHNPDSSPWKDLGKGKPFENQLKRLGEVKLDGKPAVLFKVQTEDKRFFFMFGSEKKME